MAKDRTAAAADGWGAGSACPPAALEVAVRKVENAANARGWDQPPFLLSLVGPDSLALIAPDQIPGPGAASDITLGVIPEDVVTGHPLDFLAGQLAPDYVLGLVLVNEAWTLPADVSPADAALLGPHQHPRRREVRVVTAVTRDGRVAVLHRENGGTQDYQSTTRPVRGTLVASLQRMLGLSTADPKFSIQRLVGLSILNRAITFALTAARDGSPITYDPDTAVFSSVYDTLTVADEAERLFGFAELPTWEEFREAAADGALEGMDPRVAAWMDDNMFAGTLEESFDDPEDLFATLRATIGEEQTRQFRAELVRRGWLPRSTSSTRTPWSPA